MPRKISSHLELLGLLQSEYLALKYEQTTRISLRETALGVNFVAIAAVATIAFVKSPPNLTVVLFIPIISACICWVYLNNDIMVSRLRIFFKEEFLDRVASIYQDSSKPLNRREIEAVLGSWEHFHRSKDSFRKLRRVFNFFFVSMGFFVSSFAAIVVTFEMILDSSILLRSIWILDVLLLSVITVALFLTRD